MKIASGTNGKWNIPWDIFAAFFLSRDRNNPQMIAPTDPNEMVASKTESSSH